MDGYRYLQPDNATRSGRRCSGIVSYDTYMIPSVMPDSREPVPTSSGFAITRRGGPRNVAATRAAGEEGCRVPGAESNPSKTRMRLRVRPIVPGSSIAIRRLRPRRHLPTETRTGLTVSP